MRLRWTVCPILLLSAAVAAAARQPTAAGEIKVHNIDVGQGNATLIQTPSGKNILVDTGWDFASQRLIAYLRQAGVTKLDALVITHRHMDHIGGVRAIAESFPVAKLIGPWEASAIPVSAMSHLAHLRSDLSRPKEPGSRPAYEIAVTGKVFDFGDGFRLETLWPRVSPSGKRVGNYNEESVAMRAVQRAPSGRLATFFVGGDLSVPEERYLARAMPGKLRVDWLVADHHGSHGSSQQEFVALAHGGYSRMLRALIVGEKKADPEIYRVATQLKTIGRSAGASALLRQLDPLAPRKPAGVQEPLAEEIRRITAGPDGAGPRYAVYSVGMNTYGHPNATRMSEAQLAGFTPVSTQTNGTIIMTRRFGRDGNWKGSWQATARSSKSLPRVWVPRWLLENDPAKPYNDDRREANAHWSMSHPHPEVSWSAPWDYSASWSRFASQINQGRKAWVEEYVAVKLKAASGEPAARRQLASMQYQGGGEWHGLRLDEDRELTRSQLQMIIGGANKRSIVAAQMAAEYKAAHPRRPAPPPSPRPGRSMRRR